MRTPRRPRLASLAAPALALVIGAGLTAPAGAAASDPFDEVRERVLGVVSASSTTGGAGSTTGGASSTTGGAGSPNARLGHIADPIGDVVANNGERRFRPAPRYARTIDINRFGYHVGQRTAKFTIRTRDLRRVASGQTMFWIDGITRSRAVPQGEDFNISIEGRNVRVTSTAQGACEGGSAVHDGARNTVTVRVPTTCLTGDDTPTSMQVGAMSVLIKNDWIAWDYTATSRRIDLRAGR